MVDKISVQIALEGGAEIEKQLADIGEAGQKAFADISKSAEQAGGFKELKPEEVTAQLEKLGVTGAESIEKIQAAVKSAGRLEGIVQGVQSLETAFVAVAKAAFVVGTAVVAAGLALSRYTSEAAKVAEALGPLADLSGKAMESISALQIVFARGGVAADKFASEFTALQVRVSEAARTMADDVQQSSQNIAKAHQNVEQAALSVAQAELALRDAELKAGGRSDPTPQRTARLRAQLAVEAAQQRLEAAQQAQQEAQHRLRVAEANDLKKNIKLYQDMAAGKKTAFDPLITQATKEKALLDTLAKAGADWEFVLADILKNSTALERIQIGKQLGLDPKTIETLSQGGAALRAQKAAVEALGIALTDVDRSNLKSFNDAWSTLGATASAALQKIGALLAPLGTLLAQGLTIALVQIVQGIQTTIQEFKALWQIIDAIATIGAKGIGILVTITSAGLEYVWGIIDAIATIGAKGIGILVTITSAGLEYVWGIIDAIATIGANGINILVTLALAGIADLLERLKRLQAPEAPLPEPGGIPLASGGLLGGRGTGTSDSNLAWLSRGEYITPASAVAQPGVLAFLEALRRSGGNLGRVLDGMGRFALGGMVPRPAMAFARGGLAGGMSNITIQFPGLPAIGGLRASSDVVDQLHRAAALAQVRSGGRKPSRYS